MSRVKDPVAALLASSDDAEAQFYEALREANLDKLMAIWADDEEVFCVHPGGGRLIGHAAIRAAFEAIFANGTIGVWPERLHSIQAISAAVHSVLERLSVTTREGPQTGWVMATNVYVNTAQGWRLVAHHASPGAAEMSEQGETPAVLH